MDRKEHTIQENIKDDIVNDGIPKKGRLIYLTLSILAYILCFVFLHYYFGQARAISAVIPVIVVGWLYGYKTGIFFAIFCFPANILMFALFGVNWWEEMILSGGGIAGTFALVLIGAVVGRMSEITQKSRQTEKRLRDTKNHLDNIIESSLDNIVVTDSTGNITRANESFFKLLGYKEEEIIGRHTSEFSPTKEGSYKSTTGNLVEIDRTVLDEAHTMHYKLMEEGKICNWMRHFMRKDQVLVPIEINTVFLYDKKGDVTGSVGILRDITERMMFENELKMSEEKYRNLVENANDAIISTNEEGEIVNFNKAAEKIFGYTCEEILGKSVVLLSTPSKREQQEKLFEHLKSTRELYIIGKTMEGKGIRKNGQEFPYEGSPFILEVKGEIFLTVILREITKRKELEDKLLQAEKLKSLGELAGGVAHNFNNCLAAILGRAQLLKMVIEPPAGAEEKRKSAIELKEGLDVIEQASRDGAETVRRLQEFARRKDDDKQFTTVDLNELVDNALDFTRMKWKDDAESKGIKITIEKEFSTHHTTLGSAAELREVFINLINNAVDAMPQGGEIKFKAYKEDNHVIVNVSDTGVGIPDHIKNKIFDPFFTTKGVQSSGLGMSVSYGIINRHRGTIKVDSVEGQGTIFTIKLPVRVKTAEKGKVNPISGEIKKARILVIEDEEQVRNLLSAILRKGGHEVEAATSGDQGIEIYKKNEFDLVFTDLGMPGMSGWQVAENVKGINGRVPVVLITGWGIRQEDPKMKDSYVDLIVNKPFGVDQVLNVVQEGMILRDRFKAV